MMSLMPKKSVQMSRHDLNNKQIMCLVSFVASEKRKVVGKSRYQREACKYYSGTQTPQSVSIYVKVEKSLCRGKVKDPEVLVAPCNPSLNMFCSYFLVNRKRKEDADHLLLSINFTEDRGTLVKFARGVCRFLELGSFFMLVCIIHLH